MKGFAGTVVRGAIGLVALYVVGKIAFQAGHDIAQAECRYEQLQRGIDAKTARQADQETPEEDKNETVIPEETTDIAIPEKKQSKLGMMFGLRRMVGRKESVLGKLIHHPEAHRIEAFVQGEEIHVNVKPRTA